MTYIPPSVIVQGEQNPGATTRFVIPSTVCLLGKINKYPVKNVSRVLGNGDTVTLDAKNLIQDSLKLTDYSGNVLVKDTDYTQTVDATAKTLSITVTNPDIKTQSILISYQFVPDKFFEPLKWFTKNSINDYYGQPWNDDHSINSSLSAAAEFAFNNGATSLCIIPVFEKENESDTNPKQSLTDALEKLKLQDDIAIICPIGFDKDSLIQIRNHIDWCNNNKLERRGIFAIDGIAKTYSVEDLINIEMSLDNKAVMFIPNTIASVFVSDSRSSIDLPGWLYAAAMSGLAISLPFYQSLTRMNLNGFYSVQPYLYEVKNMLAQSGGCVLEMANGNVKVRHSVVTYQKELLDWSYSGVYQYVTRAMRNLFDPYIGKPSSDATLLAIDSLAEQELSQMIDRGFIAAFDDLEVTRRNGSPDTIDVSFRYAWLAPVNWIYVNFNVDMTY